MLKERKFPLLFLPFHFIHKNNATSRCGMSRFRWKKSLKTRGVCAELRNRGLMQAVVLRKRLRLVALLRRTDEVFQESRLLQYLVYLLLQIVSTEILTFVL